MVPTRWVKIVIALFLLPVCAILSQTFFTVFTHATVTQRFWAAEEFWFFSLGAVLWLIAFFGLPKPLLMYVFGHELTHAIWVWLMGGRVSDFSRPARRRSYRDDEEQFLDRARALFFPALQHPRHRGLRRAQSRHGYDSRSGVCFTRSSA